MARGGQRRAAYLQRGQWSAVLSAEQKPLQSAKRESVPSGGCRALKHVCASESSRDVDSSRKYGVASALAHEDAMEAGY